MKKYFLIFFSTIYFCLAQLNVAMAFQHKIIKYPVRHKTVKLISLDLQNIKIRDLLILLTKVAHKNIVVSDKISGRTDIHLQDVNWREALNLIINQHGLVEQESANIIFVLPAKDKSADMLSCGIYTVPLHYAEAKYVTELLRKQKNLLSKEGAVSADIRTNAILIHDKVMRFASVVKFIRQLDIPVKQVLIEGRIVSVDSDYTKELGLQFGTVQENNANGAGGSTKNSDVSMDLPETSSNPGKFHIALAKLGADKILDMQLSALETEGHAKIISRPKLVAANNQSAYIESGEEVPYQEKTLSGDTNVAFKKAVLGLKVTPEIIGHDKIMLKLRLNQDKLSSVIVGGVPAIQTQEIQTQVRVKDGQTLVLGGIYETSAIKNITKTPILSAIPLLGKLFQHQQTETTRKELLIFVTPRMV